MKQIYAHTAYTFHQLRTWLIENFQSSHLVLRPTIDARTCYDEERCARYPRWLELSCTEYGREQVGCHLGRRPVIRVRPRQHPILVGDNTLSGGAELERSVPIPSATARGLPDGPALCLAADSVTRRHPEGGRKLPASLSRSHPDYRD